MGLFQFGVFVANDEKQMAQKEYKNLRTPVGNEPLTPEAVDGYNAIAGHPTTGEPVAIQMQPTCLLYMSWLIALIAPFQYGWMVSELNLAAYHDDKACQTQPRAHGTCLVFPGHTKAQWLLVVNAWVVGGAIGSLLSGPPMDRFGRRGAFMMNCVVMGIGAALQAFAVTIGMLVVGRLLSGIASGFGVAVTSVYISEVAPAHVRGAMGAGLQMALVMGIFLVSVCLFGAASQIGWRVINGVPMVLALVQFSLVMVVLVESPRWLVLRSRVDDARRALGRLYVDSNTNAALEELQTGPDAQRDDDSQVDADEGTKETEATSNRWKLLFRKYCPQLVATVGLAMAQQLSGINAVFYYSSSIFQDAGLADDRVGTVIATAVNAISTLAALAVMNRFMKRRMLLAGTFAMFLSSVGMTLAFLVHSTWLAIVFTALYVASFEFGLGPIPWMLASELFPNNVRAKAMSIASCINWLCNLIVGVCYPYISDAVTKKFSFLPFVVLLALSFIFIWVQVPETTNKTLEEIQRELHGGAEATSA